MTSPNPAPRIEAILRDGDIIDRLKQFRLRWQEGGDLTYLGKALVDAVVEIEALRRPAAKPPASGVDAVAELLAGLSDFDHMMACHVGIGYFDGTEITKEWDHLVRPAMERLKAAPRADAMSSFSEWWAARDQSRHEWWSVQQWAEAAWKAASLASLSPAATSGVDAGGAAVMQYRWRLKGRIEWHPGWYEGPPPPSDDDIEIETRTVYLAKPTSSPAGRVWTVKGWLPNGDGCEFTFGDESEYLRFMASKPATFDVSDIEELVVSSCGRALASLSTEVIALSPSTSAAEPVAWIDDGSTRAGSHGTAYRVVTADTKAAMPKAAAEAYRTPLYTHPAPAAVDGQRVKDGAWWDKAGARLSEDPDEAYEQVKAFTLPREVIRTRDLQRHFQIGFNRASSFIESMEGAGLISKWDAEVEGRYVIRACLATDKEGA